MVIFMNFPATGPYQPLHLVFLLIYILFFIFTTIAIKKSSNEKTRERIFKIFAVFQIIFVIIRKVTATQLHIQTSPDTYSWLSVLPDSFCSFSSMGLGIAILAGKKDNKALHFFAYLAMLGGFTSTVYPDYLYKESIFAFSTIVALLYHALDIWLVISMMVCDYFVPTIKKLHYFVIGFIAMMGFGAFEVFILKYPDAMNIHSALISDLPVLTSWYALGIECFIAVLIIIAIYKCNKKKKS